MSAVMAPLRNKLVVTICLAFILGLVSQPETASAQASPSVSPCNTIGTAAIGAIAGGILGKLTHHHNVIKGAAIGGAVGALACVAINYQSHRTQTAEQVRQENPQYRPSPQAVVTSYQIQVQPTSVQAGQPVTVDTNIGVLGGTQESVQTLSIRYDLVDSTGAVQQSVTKPVSDIQPAGGSYQNTITFTPPNGVPRGNYSVRANLLVNGQPRSEQQGTYTII